MSVLLTFLFLLNINKCQKSIGNFINSGTPIGVELSFDCTVREYAYQYGMNMQPRHQQFVDLFDALQLSACNKTRPKTNNQIQWKPPIFHSNEVNADNCIFYIDAINGNDNNDGSINSPLKTIGQGIIKTRSNRTTSIENCILYLRKGIFYLSSTISLTSKDSYLTITNYNGELVTISGGIPLQIDNNQWSLIEYKPTQWEIYNNSNNCYGRSPANKSTDNIEWLGIYSSLNDCLDTVKTAQSSNKYGAVNGFCYYDMSMGGQYGGQCFLIHDISFQPIQQNGVYSGRYLGKNIWSTKIKNFDQLENNNIYGLRINDKRGIRARYPDSITERSMQFNAISGWIPTAYHTKWLPPDISKYPQPINISYTADDYKNENVEWPMQVFGYNTTNQYTGMGNWGQFHIGQGGTCLQEGIEPNYGIHVFML